MLVTMQLGASICGATCNLVLSAKFLLVLWNKHLYNFGWFIA